MARFGAILTNYGNAAITRAFLTGRMVSVNTFALGDAGGGYYQPDPAMTELRGEKWRTSLGGGEINTLGNLLAHLILPAMALADWLLFCPKGGFRPLDPLRWQAVPVAYYGAVLGLARLGVRYYGGARYPYPFLDPIRSSPGAVLLRVALIAACWLLAGHGLLALDTALAARRGRQKAGAENSAPAG